MLSLIKNFLLFGWLSAAWNWVKSRCCSKTTPVAEETNDEDE